MGDGTNIKDHKVQLYNSDGSLDPEGLNKLRADPVLMAATERNFRVVVCNENGAEFDSLARDIVRLQAAGVVHDPSPPKKRIEDQRANPQTVEELRTLMKELGQPTSCEVPMSALPTPATLAGVSAPGKIRS